MGEAVAEGDERFVEFGVRDGARVVGVKAVEEAAPSREKAPEAAVGGVLVAGGAERVKGGVPELVEVYGAGAVGIEHAV